MGQKDEINFKYASLKCPSYVKGLPEGARDTYISFCLCQFHFQLAIPTGTESKITWRAKLNAKHLSLVCGILKTETELLQGGDSHTPK